jgi:hypothetical protein
MRKLLQKRRIQVSLNQKDTNPLLPPVHSN